MVLLTRIRAFRAAAPVRCRHVPLVGSWVVGSSRILLATLPRVNGGVCGERRFRGTSGSTLQRTVVQGKRPATRTMSASPGKEPTKKSLQPASPPPSGRARWRGRETEGVGFEPTRACALPVFKCGAGRPGVSPVIPSSVVLTGVSVSDTRSNPCSSLPVLGR